MFATTWRGLRPLAVVCKRGSTRKGFAGVRATDGFMSSRTAEYPTILPNDFALHDVEHDMEDHASCQGVHSVDGPRNLDGTDGTLAWAMQYLTLIAQFFPEIFQKLGVVEDLFLPSHS